MKRPTHPIHPKIILASSSPRRRELLASLDVQFEVHPSAFDESTVTEETPAKLVESLAYHKAKTVLDGLTGANRFGSDGGIIIGSDTVVVLEGTVLGKPRDAADACRMLASLQGRTHTVYSGLCLIRANENGTHQAADVHIAHEATRVTMRPMDDAEIVRYVETGEPMDKAGSYAIQGLGATIVTGIEGDYFTVVGLPLNRLANLLQTLGVHVF